MIPLRTARARVGLAIGDLARRAGVSPSTVYRVERGTTAPRAHIARRLAAAVGLAPEAIAELAPSPKRRRTWPLAPAARAAQRVGATRSPGSLALAATAIRPPAAAPPSVPRATPVANGAVTARDRRAKTILVVDDDPEIRWVLTEFLEGSGYRVRNAADGLAALGAVETDRPDLVLSDVWMPHLDGFGLLERLEERAVGVPIVMMSVTRFLHRDQRAAAWLSKPFDLAEILTTMEQALDA